MCAAAAAETRRPAERKGTVPCPGPRRGRLYEVVALQNLPDPMKAEQRDSVPGGAMRSIAGASTLITVQRRAGGDSVHFSGGYAVPFNALTPDRTLHFGALLTKMKLERIPPARQTALALNVMTGAKHIIGAGRIAGAQRPFGAGSFGRGLT